MATMSKLTDGGAGVAVDAGLGVALGTVVAVGGNGVGVGEAPPHAESIHAIASETLANRARKPRDLGTGTSRNCCRNIRPRPVFGFLKVSVTDHFTSTPSSRYGARPTFMI